MGRTGVVLLGVLLCGCGSNGTKHPAGRDTVVSFGDGRFQILKCNRKCSLLDLETQHTIAYDIKDWKKKGEWVYVVTKAGKCAILNYQTAFSEEFDSIADVPAQWKGELEKLE